MKNRILLLMILVASGVFAQSKENLVEVIKETNTEELMRLKEIFNQEYLEREVRINSYLERNPNVKRVENVGYGIKEIYDVSPKGEVSYYHTSNFNSSKTVRADRLYNNGSLGLNVQGQGMHAVVWDGGNARKTHVEFPNSKVINVDGNVYVDHATHVMGTILAQGITANLRGIAFDASAYSYNWNNDYAEMAEEAAGGLLVSNHSYWIGTTLASWAFGSYDTRAANFDQLAFAAPYYLAVTAAGNDRNDFSDPVINTQLSTKGGYDLCRGMQNAKNYLTIGAVFQVTNYTSPSSVLMSSFSSWGPTDDGRIKPDVVAKGVSVRSTLAGSDTDQGILQGTSMASPAVAGVGLLLQQHYHNTTSQYMRAASLKGLINHTADEAGFGEDLEPTDGPDYRFGWGLVNAEKAATIISNTINNTAILEELVLNNGDSYTKTINVSGTEPLMVSISWTDKQGVANTGTIDPIDAHYLVNDLDVRVTKNTDIYYPWTLNPAMPGAGAVRTQDNFRDNFEKVQVDNPNGTYTITVTHKGTLDGGLQNFSLIASGPSMTLDTTDFEVLEENFKVYPNPTTGVLNFTSQDILEINDVSIIDVTGKVIKVNYSLDYNTIDVSNLQSGVYFVRFTSQNKSIIKKFIKK